MRKWLVVPESRMAQFLMASMLSCTVRSRASAARAQFRVGVGQRGDKVTFNLCITLLAAPNRQKLFWNHTRFAVGGAKPYKGGGITVCVVVGKG